MSSNRAQSRFYRLLLWLFPPGYRMEFGDDMEQLYRDQLHDVRGVLVRVAYRGQVLVDAATHALREWARVTGHAISTGAREGTRMETWWQDLVFGARSLRRRPGFTIAAVLTLALGIGTTVSIYSVVNGVLLNPLPYPDSEDLVVLWTRNVESGERNRGIDHPDVRAMQQSVRGLSLAGYSGTRPTMTGLGDPQAVLGVQVTDGLIELMGRKPLLGRDLRSADDTDGGPTVMVVSHAFWSQRLSSDPDVIGRSLTFDGEAWEIVGVAPAGFDFPSGSEIWMPRRHGNDGCDHGCRILNVVGRIEGGRSGEEVTANLTAASAALRDEFPDVHRDEQFEIEAMLAYEVAEVRTALWVLLGAVAAVLLIACANVANLLLVRANSRRAEVELRAALGASRLRIVRQLLTESALIAVAAGVVGVALAHWGTAALVALAPDNLPRLEEAGMSSSVLAFSGMLVVIATGLFGVLPALHAARASAAHGQGRRTAGSRDSGRSRSALLVAEVALSLTLLLGAGLLIRTLGEIRAVELGFDTERIERFRLSLPDTRYDSVAIGQFLQNAELELTRLPEVQSAGWGFGVPLASGNVSASTILEDRPMVPPPDRPEFQIRPVTTGFLEATGTRLLLGRWFDERDRYGTESVAVINSAAVRAHYPDGDPIGRRLQAEVTWSFDESPSMTIVGVVEDVIRGSPTEPPAPAVYMPNTQFGATSGYMSMRLAPGAASAIPEARRVLRELDPSLAMWNVTTMEEVVAQSQAPTVFYTSLLSIFSLVALLLAAVGLYGVVAYAVTQRTREIGIRIALGAGADNVMGMVLREGLRPAALGILLGLGLSWIGARLLSSMLFGVRWSDPLTLLGVSTLLLAVTLAASSIPARRASRVPPATALRAD